MNQLLTDLVSPEIIPVYLKVLVVISLVLLFLFVYMLIKNNKQKRRAYEESRPQSGEIRQGKIYCNLNDPVFSNFRSSEPHSQVSDHINVSLESDLDECIGIKYYAISRNGRFLIILNGSEFWVEPAEYFASYEIRPKRKEENRK